jgi:signal transduction histidine kinase
MTKIGADGIFSPFRTLRRLALASAAVLPTAVPAEAQRLAGIDLGALGNELAALAWLSVTVGTALAAIAAFALYLRGRRDDRSLAAQKEIVALRSALDRTKTLLDADDQRTILWDSAIAPASVIGGLPERTGAPVDKAAFLQFERWLTPESAAEVDAAVEKLKRKGEAFQLVARTLADALLEVSGRTSGRRALVRVRELSGDRRSFAELSEQAEHVIDEMAALRALADAMPVAMWRRNRLGRLTWVNAAYARAVEAANADAVLSAGIELLPSRTRDAIKEAERAGNVFRDSATAIVAGERRRMQVVDFALADGSVGCAIDLSDLDVAREDLRRTTETNARTLDQLAVGVAVFDREARLRFHNAAFRHIWDLSAETLAALVDEGSILDQLRADRKLAEQANYRDWRARHLAAYRSNARREELWHLPDGRTLKMIAVPNGEGGVTYVYENVTEQISLESRLKALLALQGETLDHLTEAVAVFATDGRLKLFNPVFANIWRLSPARLRQEPHISDIIAECQAIYASRAEWDEIRTAVTDLDHDAPTTGRMYRPDSSVIDYATVALPEGLTMLTFVDVTDSARIQRVLSERNEALEAADRLKSEFIQHVSYELRSPLQTIIGFSELLAGEAAGGLTQSQREYIEHIDSSSRSLLALINDILDLATVDAGIMSLDIEEADIAAVAHSAVEGLRDRLGEQRIELEMAIPRDIGTFHVDAQRVRQILFNLVSNALRFSNAGGHIRVSAARQGGFVRFTVADNGVGIPEAALPDIFRPFEAHSPQGRRAGAGLGLSIVKSLVELHGGTVEIASREGVGTTATIRLPALPAAAAAAAE